MVHDIIDFLVYSIVILTNLSLLFVFIFHVILQAMALYLLAIKKNKCIQNLGVDKILLFSPILLPLKHLESMELAEGFSDIKRFLKLIYFYRIYVLASLILLVCFITILSF